MKKIAILVIAATNQPVYLHYIKTYWTELINYTNKEKSHIDVFLLLENGAVTDAFSHVLDNVIEDQNADLDQHCEPQFQRAGLPSILSKTIYAYELLHDKYDVFFRTNLSSFIKLSAFDDYVQTKDSIIYSGAWIWRDALRQDLLHHNKIGSDQSIKSLAELDGYEGNTFFSGAGYFLNAQEARSLAERKESIRYDIIDDVSVGLMFSDYEELSGFSTLIEAKTPTKKIVQMMHDSHAPHIRLQHFPLEVAEAVWQALENDPVWK